MIARTAATGETRQVDAVEDLTGRAGVPAGADTAVAAAGVRGRGGEPGRRAAVGAGGVGAPETAAGDREGRTVLDRQGAGDRAAHRRALGEGDVGAAADRQVGEHEARWQLGVAGENLGVHALDPIADQDVRAVAQLDRIEAILAFVAHRADDRPRAFQQQPAVRLDTEHAEGAEITADTVQEPHVGALETGPERLGAGQERVIPHYLEERHRARAQPGQLGRGTGTIVTTAVLAGVDQEIAVHGGPGVDEDRTRRRIAANAACVATGAAPGAGLSHRIEVDQLIGPERDATAAARTGALTVAARVRAAAGDIDQPGAGNRAGGDQDAAAGTTRTVRLAAEPQSEDRAVKHQVADVELDDTAAGSAVVGAVLVAGTAAARELGQVDAVEDLTRGA